MPQPELKIFQESFEIPKVNWDWEVVTDWSKRIQNYSEDQKRFYAQMLVKLEEVKEIQNSVEGWSTVETKDVKIELRKSERGLFMMRANSILDWPVLDVYRCMAYFPFRSEWDINTEYAEHVKKIGVNAFVSYSKSKKQYVVSSRDFVVNYLCNVLEDGSIIDACTTDSVEVIIAEKPSTIRASTPITGLILRPDPEDAGKTLVFTTTELDPKGLPDWAIKSALKD